jgi:hypothetical protein
MTTDVDDELPPIAIAPPRSNPESYTMWVRSHGEMMMLRDIDGRWALFFFAANHSVQFQKFHGTTDPKKAAGMMRKYVSDQGLVPPEDLDD